MITINDWNNGHYYTLVLLGAKKNVSRLFKSRDAANTVMYELMGKLGLSIEKVYDDKHDKTYICNNGAEFHINRC